MTVPPCRCLSCDSAPATRRDRADIPASTSIPRRSVAVCAPVVEGGLAARGISSIHGSALLLLFDRANSVGAPFAGGGVDRSAVLGPGIRRDDVGLAVGRHDRSPAPRTRGFDRCTALRNRDADVGVSPRWCLRRAAPTVDWSHPRAWIWTLGGWSHQQRHRWRSLLAVWSLTGGDWFTAAGLFWMLVGALEAVYFVCKRRSGPTRVWRLDHRHTANFSSTDWRSESECTALKAKLSLSSMSRACSLHA